MKKISIITPVFNGEKYIAETIESIIFQRGDFILEYIIMDGGSNDRTLEICALYRDLLDKFVDRLNFNKRIIKIYSQRDNGLYDALAKGVKECSGDIIGYLNSSDRYLPGTLSSVVRAFENNDIKWLTGWNTFADEKGAIFEAKYPFRYDAKLIQSFFYGRNNNHIQQESTFWSKDLLDCIDLKYLSGLKYAGDFYLWSKFSKKAHLWVVNALLGNFRVHKNQQSSMKNEYYKEVLTIKSRKKYYFRSLVFMIFDFLPNKLKRYTNRYSINLFKKQ